MFEIKQLIAAFPYDSVGFGRTEIFNRGVRVNDVPQAFVQELWAHLNELTRDVDPGWLRDNKTTFIWLDTRGMLHAGMFYDGTFYHMMWSVLWDTVPINFYKGIESVLDAVQPMIDERHARDARRELFRKRRTMAFVR